MILKRVLLLMASVAVGLLLAESALRFVAPVYTSGIQGAYRYDPELGVTLRKSVHLFRETDHLEEVRTNRYGTADFHDDYGGYDGLIFALGDSYTQGTGLPADESYPVQLDLTINRSQDGRYKKRYAVVNLGLAAFGGEQSFLVLERYSRILGKPVACLYLGTDNDYDDDLMFRSGARHRHIVYGSPTWGNLAPALIWVGNLQLVLRVKLLLAGRRLAKIRAAAESDAAQSGPGKPREKKSVAELEWPVIARIAKSCRSMQAEIILAWSTSPKASNSYEWLQSKASASSIPFNDWYPRVVSVTEAMPSLETANPHSAGHYRGWVAREIALGFDAKLHRPVEPR